MQKIEQLEAGELLLERKNADMETLYLGANYRGASDVYLLTFTTDEATWLQFKASVPKGAIVYHRFCWSNEAIIGSEPEEKPKKESGPHAAFWEILFGKRFWLDRSLWEVLKVDTLDSASAKQLLHDSFETTSLSLVSPTVWETFCASNDLHNLFNMSRTVAAKLEEQANAKAS